MVDPFTSKMELDARAATSAALAQTKRDRAQTQVRHSDEMLASKRVKRAELLATLAELASCYWALDEVLAGPEDAEQLTEQLERSSDDGGTLMRHFVCRNKNCSPEGHYYSSNNEWISNEYVGGWKFMCPVCGQAFQAFTPGLDLLPAQFVLQLPGGLILSAGDAVLGARSQCWGWSAGENLIAEMMSAMAEENFGRAARELSQVDLQLQVWEGAKLHSNAIPDCRDMQLSDTMREYVANQNKSRTKQNSWSLESVANGFRGGFFKYDKESTIIMSTEQTKVWLAQVGELMRRRENLRRKTSL